MATQVPLPVMVHSLVPSAKSGLATLIISVEDGVAADVGVPVGVPVAEMEVEGGRVEARPVERTHRRRVAEASPPPIRPRAATATERIRMGNRSNPCW